jgi:replicative DNA helicase
MKILHDRETGLSSVWHDEDTDVLAVIRRCGTTGLTAKEAANIIYSVEHSSPAQVQKARRKLTDFVSKNLLRLEPGGGKGSAIPDKYFPIAPASWGDEPGEWYR